MNRLLLDTSAYSAYRLGHLQLREELREAEAICMSPIVLGELRSGFLGGRKGQANETELQTFLSTPRVRIVEIGEETSYRYGVIVSYLRGIGVPIPTNDAWIAASAMEHGLAVLTTDTHFQRVPQIRVIHHPPRA